MKKKERKSSQTNNNYQIQKQNKTSSNLKKKQTKHGSLCIGQLLLDIWPALDGDWYSVTLSWGKLIPPPPFASSYKLQITSWLGVGSYLAWTCACCHSLREFICTLSPVTPGRCGFLGVTHPPDCTLFPPPFPFSSLPRGEEFDKVIPFRTECSS